MVCVQDTVGDRRLLRRQQDRRAYRASAQVTVGRTRGVDGGRSGTVHTYSYARRPPDHTRATGLRVLRARLHDGVLSVVRTR